MAALLRLAPQEWHRGTRAPDELSLLLDPEQQAKTLSRRVRATLIVNPCSHRVTDERLRAVEETLGRFADITTMRTERRGHATELARVAVGDAIFAYGGDGLFNEVLNGVEGTIPVGFIPGGHTNVLPRALGFPGDRSPRRCASRSVARGASRSAVSTGGGSPSRRALASARRRCATSTRSAGRPTVGVAAISPSRDS
ncbi:MAG: acylglycerol kinase family protein [Actinobacteria bacterium]|nr:acylglycerol kinase family protein [Actinomycetota bacterium]